MRGSIDQVREDSEKYVNGLDVSEFVSVIIFSGEGTARLIAGPTRCDAKGKELVSRAIREEVRLIGTTVFSEPLERTMDTVKRLAGEDTVHNAVLFTDGCAVPTRSSVKEEQNKAVEMADTLRKLGAIVSVIGYGVYYDQAFLEQLMAAAGNSGVFRHISEIDDFAPTIQSIREAFEKTVLAQINLTAKPDVGAAGAVYKTTPEVLMVSSSGNLQAQGLYDGTATFFVELTAVATKVRVSGTIDGKAVDENVLLGNLTDSDVSNYVRALGAYAFLKGDKAQASELLGLVGDDLMSDKTASAFTAREQREVADTVRGYFRDKKFIGAGLKPQGSTHSVLNALRVLIEDPENVVYIPKGAYKRSGEATSDPRVIHSPNGKTLQVKGYSSHNSRLNFSLLALKDVKVKPEEGGAPVDMKIWRTYNLILDGNLHLPELEANLNEQSFQVLKDAGVIENDRTYAPSKTYTLDFRNLRMISSSWANPGTLGFVSLIKEEAELEAEQKALNARRKALKASLPADQQSSGDDDEEEEESGNIYRENAQKVKGLETETYWADCVEIRLMKYKAKDYSDDAVKLSLTEATTRVKEVRNRLRTVRFLTRAITFAMKAVDSKSIPWGEEKTTQKGEWPKQEQLAQYGGAELKRVTWQEKFVCS